MIERWAVREEKMSCSRGRETSLERIPVEQERFQPVRSASEGEGEAPAEPERGIRSRIGSVWLRQEPGPLKARISKPF